jgi:hypothetical protein
VPSMGLVGSSKQRKTPIWGSRPSKSQN